MVGAGRSVVLPTTLRGARALPGKLIASQSGRIVESSAAAADAGGPISGLKALFAGPAAVACSWAKPLLETE